MSIGIRLREKPSEQEKSDESPFGDGMFSDSAKVESGTETEAKKIDRTKQEAREPFPIS
jgi:hypothetical protein